MKVCRKCKKPVPNESQFCLYCGAALEKQQKKKASSRPNGSGSIRYLKGRSRPYAAYLPRRLGGGYLDSYATKAEANEALMKEIATRPDTPRVEWTVKQFYDYYTSSDDYNSKSDKWKESVRIAWKYCGDVADMKMRDVRGTLWQGCIDKAFSMGKSKSMAEKIRSLISALCKEAMRDNVILQNYSKLLTIKGTDTKPRDIFSDDEIALLRAHDDDVQARFILILIYTGMRINELLQLKCGAVYINDMYIVGGEKTAAGKNRTIPILPIIAPYIVEAMRGKSKDDNLITRNGKLVRIEYARKIWFYKYLVHLGILTPEEVAVGNNPRLVPHCTRKTFASLARRAKVEPDILARIIGHTDYKTTDEIYVRLQAQFLSEELAVMNPDDV